MTEIKPGDKLRIIDDVSDHGFEAGAIVTALKPLDSPCRDAVLVTTLPWGEGEDLPRTRPGETAWVLNGADAVVIRPEPLPEPQPMLPEWTVRKVLLSLGLEEPYVGVTIAAARGYGLVGDE